MSQGYTFTPWFFVCFFLAGCRTRRTQSSSSSNNATHNVEEQRNEYAQANFSRRITWGQMGYTGQFASEDNLEADGSVLQDAMAPAMMDQQQDMGIDVVNSASMDEVDAMDNEPISKGDMA